MVAAVQCESLKGNLSEQWTSDCRSGRGLFCKIEEGNETENKLPFGEKKMIMVACECQACQALETRMYDRRVSDRRIFICNKWFELHLEP
ncbi:hypothetical protein E5288_WYG007862 [Bos mutus]|uniref:Uncharacterized protein n=1 Tax=Bos mutus TaxID=72004 RepID=A0A6B0RP05_9CETA|nr:hypothetical protein [Bos mutus]